VDRRLIISKLCLVFLESLKRPVLWRGVPTYQARGGRKIVDNFGATHLQADARGEASEGLKKRYESLSIGFQVNRAIRIEHIMKRGLFGGFGLGVEEVRGLG
jgi:hypothetical protein